MNPIVHIKTILASRPALALSVAEGTSDQRPATSYPRPATSDQRPTKANLPVFRLVKKNVSFNRRLRMAL